MELTKTYRFEASHVLPKHTGKCSRLHGHSWVLHVSVEGSIDLDTGFVMDFADISSVVKPLIERLDHHHLGTWDFMLTTPPLERHMVPGLPINFYPTSENLLVWIALQLHGLDVWKIPRTTHPEISSHPGQVATINYPDDIKRIVNWSRLAIEETCTSKAVLTREEYDGAKTYSDPGTLSRDSV